MNPRFPIYIVSKGRHEKRATSRALERIGVPYFIVVEEQERDLYASVIDEKKILVLDNSYKRDYDLVMDLGSIHSTGPGPARNFAWDHSIASGHEWHWVMDDNIRWFQRLYRNRKIRLGDGTGLRVMEDFCLRYENIAMAGPNYHYFASRKEKMAPLVMNTRIYSCILIQNRLPHIRLTAEPLCDCQNY